MATKKPIVLESGVVKEIASTDTIPLNNLGSGTTDSSTYLRGDGTWSTAEAFSINTLAAAFIGA